MKRWFCLIFSIVLLLTVSLFYLQWEKPDPILSLTDVSLSIKDRQGETQISLWKDDDIYYAFLPSYCILDQLVLPQYQDNVILIDNKKLKNFDGFEFNTPYEIILYDKKNCILEQSQLILLRSANIPTVYIETQSGSMTEIHADKSISESGTITVINDNGIREYQGLLQKINGRGNATWLYDKRPYNIDLEEAVSLLNMPKGKKWCLMANYLDASSLRNQLVNSFSRDILQMNDVCESAHVDLYLNGIYAGLYLLSEPVEVGAARLNITDLDHINKITNQKDLTTYPTFEITEPFLQKGVLLPNEPDNLSGGYLLELDLQERYGEEISGFQTYGQQTIIIKNPKFASQNQLAYIGTYVNDFEQALLNESGCNDLGISYLEYIDLTSWCKKYLAEEFFENLDSGLSSQFLYKPAETDNQDDVLYAGPLWDFDWSCGNGDISIRIAKNLHAAQVFNTSFYYSYWYQAFNEKIEFQTELEAIYREIYPQIPSYLEQCLNDLADHITFAWEMDRLRWSNSEHHPSTVQFETLQEHSAYIYSFLTERAEFLYDYWCNHTTYYTLTCDPQNNGRFLYYSLQPKEFVDLPVLYKDGYDFLGWYYDNGQYFDGSITKDTTVYGFWKKQEGENAG